MGLNSEVKTDFVQRDGAVCLSETRRVALVIYYRDGACVVPVPTDSSLTIGRSINADIRIEEPSLSRVHARFTLGTADDVTVEDLDSTNGLRAAGVPVSQAILSPGDEVLLGTVNVSVHKIGPLEQRQHLLEGHDVFLQAMEAELARCRTFGRELGLLMVRAANARAGHLRRWHLRVRQLLRPFDRLALYGAEQVEIAMLEASREELLALAKAIVDKPAADEPALVCGAALFPQTAQSLESLIEQAREAAQQASISDPIRLSPNAAVYSWGRADRVPDRPAMIAHSSAMRDVIATVHRVASSAIPVLIQGETGTGKEVIAHALHQRSRRQGRPFDCINCGAIPSALIESVLFGHERGAFTGAERRARGVFEAADGGTILLDEIAELAPSAQTALLRVLENKRVTRVGAVSEIPVDVRVVAATHRNLEQLCREGGFRWDLYYRLNGVTIVVPPLRERRADIKPLAVAFLRQANQENNRKIEGFTPEAMTWLEQYDWPGNARELRNVVARAVVLAEEGAVSLTDLPGRVRGLTAAVDQTAPRTNQLTAPHQLRQGSPASAQSLFDTPNLGSVRDSATIGVIARSGPGTAAPPDPVSDGGASLPTRMQRFEQWMLCQALQASDGNRARAAELLGLPQRTFFYRLRRAGIEDWRLVDKDVPAEFERARSRGKTLREALQLCEQQLLANALERHHQSKQSAARELGITLRTLNSKLRR